MIGWTKIEHKQPPDVCYLLVALNGGLITVAFNNDSGEIFDVINQNFVEKDLVSHWMIPDPPGKYNRMGG